MQATPSNGAAADKLLTAEQAAEILAVPPSWVLAQARAGTLPCVRLSRYVRFRRAELDQFIEDQLVMPKGRR